jgi:hypothetical protein
MKMKTPRFLITLACLTLIPLGASAQVDAGDDVVLECESENGTEYTLNGTAPIGDGIVNAWTTAPELALENADTLTPTGLFPLGMTTATLTSTVSGGTPDSDSVDVTVEDSQPPVVRLKAEPAYLWPPNHDMRNVEIKARVQDRCSGADGFSAELISVKSNEPDNGNGDGNTLNDIQGADIGSDDRNVQLRAERAGGGDGRIYTLTYRITDGSGNETNAEAKVYVPHDASDLKDLIGDENGDRDDMDPICPRPAQAIAELTQIFPGLGSVRNEQACNKICKTWAKSCERIAKGTAKCVQGEEKALALIAVAECKDSDDRPEIRICREEVKQTAAQQKIDLKQEASDALDTCARQGQRCANACDDLFGDVPTPL